MDIHTNKINDKRLTIKLIAYLFLFSMIYTLVYSVIDFNTKYNEEVKKIDDSFSQIEKTVLEQLALSLWQMDDTQLKIQLNSTLKFRGVVFVEIIEKGKALISVGVKQSTDFKESVFDLQYYASNVSNNLGLVRVQVSYSNITKHLWGDISNLAISELLKFLILTFLLLVVVHNLIIKHLLTMADYAKKLNIEHLNKPLELNRDKNQDKPDVLDNVSEAINQMRKNILAGIGQMEIVQEKLSISNKTMENEIVDKVKAQNEIKVLNEELEQKVYDRTKALEKSNEELQKTLYDLKKMQNQLIHSEKMASLGGLVAGIAHEINTPVGMGLTGITHFLEISKDIKKLYSADNLSEEEFREYLNISNDLAKSININLVRAADLIKSFKQVAVDQSSEAKRVFNLGTYIHEILASMKNITKKSNIEIEIDCKENLIISSYPGAFSQIITNLVMNSYYHGFNETNSGTINIKIISKHNSVILKYSDDGKGIKKADLPKIYNPFYTTNREKGGSGLGMNILYNIIKTTFMGEIECVSVENEGVNFTIELNGIEFVRNNNE